MTPFELGILFATFYAFYLDVWQLFGIISFDHIIQCNCDRTHQFQYLLPQYLVQFSIHHDLDIFSPKTSPDNKYYHKRLIISIQLSGVFCAVWYVCPPYDWREDS